MGGYDCACERGFERSDDGSTCVGEFLFISFYLVKYELLSIYFFTLLNICLYVGFQQFLGTRNGLNILNPCCRDSAPSKHGWVQMFSALNSNPDSLSSMQPAWTNLHTRGGWGGVGRDTVCEL